MVIQPNGSDSWQWLDRKFLLGVRHVNALGHKISKIPAAIEHDCLNTHRRARQETAAAMSNDGDIDNGRHFYPIDSTISKKNTALSSLPTGNFVVESAGGGEKLAANRKRRNKISTISPKIRF